MPAIQYPFIDIAVHPRVRERFARGEAMVLFSTGLDRVLWANGAGAALFGFDAIYDFVEQGAKPGDVSFRQISATAHQLSAIGDNRNFLIRMASGFRRSVVNASVELIKTPPGEDAVLFSAPISGQPAAPADSAGAMLEGFDDPDTHMAVIGRDGEVIAASANFGALDITPQTARMLITMAGAQPDRLIKRPIPTGQGYLPAALGRLSDIPSLNLLFVVETAIGHLDPIESFDDKDEVPVGEILAETAALADEPLASVDAAAAIEPAAPEAPSPKPAAADDGLSAMIDAVSGIEELEEEPEEPAIEDDAIPAADAQAEQAGMEPCEDATQIAETAAQDEQAETHASGETSAPAGTPWRAEERALAEEPTHVEMTETSAEEAGDHADVPSVPAESHDQAELPDAGLEDETSPQEVIADPSAQDIPVATPEAPADRKTLVPAAAETGGFAFRPSGRATRFVWKIDAEGRFSEVSHEFAEAVGPHATNVAGVAFTDIAALFNLDPDGKIAELLERRDTWSGRTIHWPVEGTSLMVPVDLAALPTYTRSREFDGFRGFGVVRLSDAIEDPLRLGLTLGPAREDHAAAPDQQDPAHEPEVENSTTLAAPLPSSEVEQPGDASAEEAPQPVEAAAGGEAMPSEPSADVADENETISEADGDAAAADSVEPVADDPPALVITETPNRRLSDKIIRLHEHRSNIRQGLSTSEKAAFDEIARQLQPIGADDEMSGEHEAAGEAEAVSEEAQSGLTATDTPTAANENDADAEQLSTEEEMAAEAPADAGDQHKPHTAKPEAQAAEPAAQDAEPEAQAAVDAGDEQDIAKASDAADADHDAAAEAPIVDATEPEEDFNPLDVLSTVIPPRVKMANGLSPEIVDQMPVALLVHAGDTLIHANPELLRLTGYASLAAIEEVGGLDALLQRHDLDSKTDRPGMMMVVRADDALIPVTARLQSIRWEDASALMLALMPVEKAAIPEEQPTELREEARPERMLEKVAKLQVEVEELQSILETATDGVVIIGPEGDIRSMNRSASALFNYDDQETRGKPFAMLFAHESQKAVQDYLAGLSGHGVASVLNDGREVIGREASGGFVPLFMTMGRLNSSNGYCAVIRDITQWKRTEEELRNAKRAAETANAHKSDFLARVSHEIRTPLNAIIGFSDMMAGERFGPIGHSRYVEYANDIGRSGRHVLDIVNDLLDISKIEAGEMDLEFSAVGLNEAVAEAVALVQPQANSQRVIIRTALSQAVPNIVADLRSIKQIALNILSNAIRFTPSGGQIVVSTAYEPNGTVVMRIRDTGVGMTRSELEQAMKPFRQVAAQTRQRGDGTGLGLPLTKAMVDANRAIFSIHSAPNEGTLVEVTFPSPRVLAN